MFESISGKFQSVFKKLRGRGRLTETNIKDALREVRFALLEADVNYKVVKDFLERVRVRAIGEEVVGSLLPGQQVIKIVHEEMAMLMGPAPAELSLQKLPSVIMLVGLQGCGKTTMCAKLAYFFKNKGKTVFLIPADTRRPAAREQLDILGKEVGVPVYGGVGATLAVAQSGDKPHPYGNPVNIIREGVNEARARNLDIVLIDTSGRLHIDDELMNELTEMKKEIVLQEVLLVVDAMTGQDAVRSASEFENRVGIDGVILTKLDGDARGGAALSVRAVTGKPVRFVGVGEKIDALEPFLPDRIASRILGMGDVLTLVEKVERAVTEEERKKWEKKVVKDFTMDDLLSQLRLTKKMGGLKELAGMLPGGGNLPGMDIDESKLKRAEAIIQSMTRDERKNLSIINGSRRSRIASGSGTSVQEVNVLLKQFTQTRKFMKNFSKGIKIPIPLTPFTKGGKRDSSLF